MRPAVVWSRSRGSHLTLFDFSTSPSLASLCAWYLTPLFPLSSSTLAMTETHTSTHYPSPTLPRLWLTELGPALPLSQLGNCLRPPSGRGPQNFRKEGVEGEKIWFQMNLKKIRHVLLTKKQNFYYIRLNIGSTKIFYWSKQNQLSQK